MDKTTAMNWALFLAVVGAGYWYYSGRSGRAVVRNRGRALSRATSANPTAAKGEVQRPTSQAKPKAKAAKPTKAKAAKKNVKKAVQEVSEKAASAIGSDDRDDDVSSVGSPERAATTSAKAHGGKDVSDMLEPRVSVPSVLKINASEKPAGQSKPQQKRLETPQETKKQRQNRKKVEEAKQQREADEKHRQVLLEQQRRTAREARGEPAKNGIQASVPKSNAWASDRPAAQVVAAPAQNGQLLDTFEPEQAPAAAATAPAAAAPKAAATNGNASAPKTDEWTVGLTEEEQLRMALEDSAWETVPKGKKQKKTKTAEETTTSEEPLKVEVPKAAPAKQVTKAENKQPLPRFEVLEKIPDVGHPMDSDWGVI